MQPKKCAWCENTRFFRCPAMKIYSLERTENFPISRKEAWNFFSNLTNLPKITLAELSLRISDGGLGEIYPGMIITYTVTPVFRIRWRWATEITHVKAPAYFVDEQRFGPYRFWHHQYFLFRPKLVQRLETSFITHCHLDWLEALCILGWFEKDSNIFLTSEVCHYEGCLVICERGLQDALCDSNKYRTELIDD